LKPPASSTTQQSITMAQTAQTIQVSNAFFDRHPFETSDGRRWASLRAAADTMMMSGVRAAVKYKRGEEVVELIPYADAMKAPPMGRPIQPTLG